MSTFRQFVKISRVVFVGKKTPLRTVYLSELEQESNGIKLSEYVSDRAPLFYRDVSKLIESLKDGFFITPFKDTLNKIPKSKSFQESHFGEIVAGIFASETIGYQLLYSKLSLLTAENSNAYKMDLVMYDPSTQPVEFVFGEVKSSPKGKDVSPACHDKSCYADIFNSLRTYSENDLEFDLTAAKDRLALLDEVEQNKVKNALKPYSQKIVKYAGFAVIDIDTKDDSEMEVLTSRKSKKAFDVDVICIKEYKNTAAKVYNSLIQLRKTCSSTQK